MGLFDSLFDKREKMDYCRGCDFLFTITLMQQVQYPLEFSDISDRDYRTEIAGVVTAYLDTKPQEKCVRVRSTFGKDAIYYGTVHAPAEYKSFSLPKCKEKHLYYSEFISTRMGGTLDATTSRVLATELLRQNRITPDTARLNAVITDINKMVEIVDATLSTYKFV